MNRDVIIALDFDNKEEVIDLLNKLNQEVYVKVGMELFYSEGLQIIKIIKDLNHKVFLDLKVHDIPNTAAGAMRSLKKLDVDIVNVHCAGGIKMMKEAKEIFKGTNTLVIGVTQLTSTSQEVLENELLIDKNIDDVVLEYAKNAKKAGLDGVVCSPLEAKSIHEEVGSDFKTVCPGIRYASGSDDQVRITTPEKARDLTCDYIVVGRPITKSENPAKMYQKIKKEFEG
ncbi:orotidine-5'-phosphate decarboxylase [Bacilli bacterium PM5-3]|nr:orotidine-5'-phosphate decarboxylase [Bacilli bacterium PM5-3]